MGLEISLSDIKIESLVPKELEDVSIDQFITDLPKYDEAMNKIREKALSEGLFLFWSFLIFSSS